MSSRPPLAGYNHNVNYRHRQYHVQTEDSGTENPRLDTHLFQGGMIIESAKTDYADLLEVPNSRAVIKAKMQTQHKSLMKMLIHGELDDKIITYLGTLDPEEEFSVPVLEMDEAGSDAVEEQPAEAEAAEAEAAEAEAAEAEAAAAAEAEAAAAAEAEAAAEAAAAEVTPEPPDLDEDVLDQVYADAEAASVDDGIYTSMDGLDQMYQELDEEDEAARSAAPDYQTDGGTGEEESFDFELSGGETADIPSVTKAIEDERKQLLSDSDWTSTDPAKDEAFEVTLDGDQNLSLDEAREETESAFAEMDLDRGEPPKPNVPAYSEDTQEPEPEVSAGSAADWLELDYPEDALGGRYDLESASDDELFNATGLEEGYGVQSGSELDLDDEDPHDFPPAESFADDAAVSPTVSFEMYPGESGEQPEVAAEESAPPEKRGGDELFSSVSEVTPATLNTEVKDDDAGSEAVWPLTDTGRKEPSFADSFTDLSEEGSTSELSAVAEEEEVLEPEPYQEPPPSVARPQPRPSSQPTPAPQPQRPHSSSRVIRSRGPSGYFQRVEMPENQGATGRASRDTIPVSTLPFDPEEPPPFAQVQAPTERDAKPTVRQAQPPIPAMPQRGGTRTPAPQTPPPPPGPVRRSGQTAGLETRGLLENERQSPSGRQASPQSPSAISYPIAGAGQQGQLRHNNGGQQRPPTRPRISREEPPQPQPRAADIPRTPSGRYPVAPVRGRPVGAVSGGPSPSGVVQPPRPERYPQASSPQRFTAPRQRSSQTTPAVKPSGNMAHAPNPGTARQAGVSRSPGTWRQQQGGGPQPTMRRVSPIDGSQGRKPVAPARSGVRVSQNVVIGQGRPKAPPAPRRGRAPVQSPPAQPRPPARPNPGSNWPSQQAGSIQASAGQRRPVPARVPPPQAGAGGERTLDEVILDYLNDQEKERGQ